MTDTWRLPASYEIDVRFPSGSNGRDQPAGRVKHAGDRVAEGIDPAPRPCWPHRRRVVILFPRAVDRGDGPARRVEHRRGDKAQRVRRAHGPAGRVKSEGRAVPERVHARGHAARIIIDCRVSIPKSIDLGYAAARGVVDRGECVPQRIDARDSADSRYHKLLSICCQVDRSMRPHGSPSQRPWCFVLPSGSIDATGLFAASNTVVDTKPRAFVLRDRSARRVIARGRPVAERIDGRDHARRIVKYTCCDVPKWICPARQTASRIVSQAAPVPERIDGGHQTIGSVKHVGAGEAKRIGRAHEPAGRVVAERSAVARADQPTPPDDSQGQIHSSICSRVDRSG